MKAILRVLLSLGLLVVGISGCQHPVTSTTVVRHRVPPALPSTPASAPPAVKASLTASPDHIVPGEPVTITWSTENANQVTLEGIGNVDLSGFRVVKPVESTTYHLVAIGPGGTQETTVLVQVEPIRAMALPPATGTSDDSTDTPPGSAHKKKARSSHSGAGSASYAATGGNWAGYLGSHATASSAAQPTVTPEGVLQGAINNLPTGQVAFHHPSEMQVDQAEEVQVRISRDVTANLVADLPQSDDLGHHETAESQQIKVSTSMKVQLNGDPYFKVTPLNSEEQLIETTGSSDWRFTVVPLQKGKWPLHLKVTAVVRSGDLEKEKDLKVLDEQVTVTITTFAVVESFIVGNWQWLFGTLLIPLAVWLWPKLKSKSARAQSA